MIGLILKSVYNNSTLSDLATYPEMHSQHLVLSHFNYVRGIDLGFMLVAVIISLFYMKDVVRLLSSLT